MADPSERINELKIDRTADHAGVTNWLWPAFGVALAVLIAIWWVFLRPGSAAVPAVTETARRPPSAGAASSVLDASGYVVARRQATVSSEVTGKVMEVLIEEGMRVEKGQVVARLDDSTERAQLSLAAARADSSRAALAEIEARLRNALLERNRLRDLAARDLASTSSLDAAEANYDELKARLQTGRENVHVAERSVELAEDGLSNMTIRAPFAGVVVSKNAQPGEMISPVSAGGGFTRTGICTIVDMDSLEVEVDVNEAYIQRVRGGQRVSATLDAYPDWQIPAEVIAIVPTADRQKATVRVRIGFVERDERVLRDMGVKVAFLDAEAAAGGREADGVLITRDALRSDAEGYFVWRVSGNVVERRGVEVDGNTDRDAVLVVNGLAAGDTVVRSSAEALTSGQRVAPN